MNPATIQNYRYLLLEQQKHKHVKCLIQECVNEDVDLKREVHNKIDSMMDHKAILASSTSCILPARIADHLNHRNRFLVAHPVSTTVLNS